MATPIKKSSKRLTPPRALSPPPIHKSSSTRYTNSTKELLTPNPESLDSLCLTKKRVLEGIKITAEEIPEEFLATQLKKDEILNSLNLRILSLRFKVATKTKSTKEKLAKQKVENLMRKIENVASEKQKIQAKVESLQGDQKNKGKNEEFQKIQAKIDETRDITEMLKEENYLKGDEMKETQNDLKEIKKILKGMTDIYVNVQSKMDEKRTEINDLNLKYFEMVLGTLDIEELEEKFKVLYVQGSRVKQEKEKIQKKFKKVKKLFEKIQKFPHTIEHVLEDLKELDGFIESIIDEREIERILTDSKDRIGEVKAALHESLNKKLKVLENPDRKSKAARAKYKENEKILKDLEKECQKLEKNPSNSTLTDQISKLSSMESTNKLNLENLLRTLDELKKKTKSSKENLKNILNSNQSTEFEFNSLKTRLETVTNQAKLVQTSKKNEATLHDELKAELGLLVKKLGKAKSDSFAKENMNESRKIKNIVSQVTVLHEELMKKDTQILKRLRELLRTQKETKKVQKNIESYEQKIAKTKEEHYEKVSEQIEKKDKEISMLKDILKGNTSEIRAKEVLLSGIKKQLETSTPRINEFAKRRDVKSK